MLRSRLALVLACTIVPALSAAQTPRDVALHYTRSAQASTCVGPTQLAEQVEAYTGPVLVPSSQADTAIAVHVARTRKGGFRARITLEKSTALATDLPERVLEHPARDCDGFEVALAFVIATMIDPDLALTMVDAAIGPAEIAPGEALLEDLESDPPHPVPLAHAQPTPAVAPPSSPGEQPQPRWSLALGATLASGLPTPALGPSIGVGLHWHWLEARLWSRINVGVKDAPVDGDYRIDGQLFGTSLLLGPRGLLWKRLGASLGIGADVTLTRMRGQGFDDARTAWLSTWAGLVRGGLFTALAASYSLELAGYLRATGMTGRFTFDQLGREEVAFEMPRTSLGAELSVSHTF